MSRIHEPALEGLTHFRLKEREEMNSSSDTAAHEKNVETGFMKVLNLHGYGFHYSVLKLASELYANGSSKWFFEAAEFPVQVQGLGTRIDFVLQHVDSPSFYLLAECKRVNPALSNWCFARAPFVRRNRSEEAMFLEHFHEECGISLKARHSISE